MNRRQLLKLVAASGLGVAAPGLMRMGFAQGIRYEGPYWIFIHAGGGWDPRFHFDPTTNIEQNTLYTEIGTVGGINFAPLPIDLDAFGLVQAAPEPCVEAPPPTADAGAAGAGGAPAMEECPPPPPAIVNPLITNEEFLTRHGSKMLVINGIDMGTNSHDEGSRAILSGATPEGSPAIGALLAAQYGATQPIPFISFGGYDNTFGLSPLTRVGSSGALRDIAFPNVVSPDNEDSDDFHTPATYARIRAAQGSRLDSLVAGQHLPNLVRAKEALLKARASDSDLQALQIPDLIEFDGNTGDMERMVQGAQLAVAGFQAGLTVSANLSIGGFDTHGNHDADQSRQMIKLISGIGHILDLIEAQGMSGKVNILVGSDFGRTPHYNENNGKDHWPISSMLAFGPNIQGGRVVGASTADQLAQSVDPTTLVVGSGIKITPAVIHRALRNFAGIDTALQERFPIVGEDLPLFG
jgi:uncharacterized protein (DUF1501 family)